MPNANIDYVTSHQGQAHITTQNVIDLLAGLSGDVSGIKKFPQLYNGLSHEITDTLTIQVKTGAALAGGSFFILEDAYDWLLDPGTVGYSRIDILFLVMYEDPDTSVQTCDFVYEVGNLYPNGTTGTVPSAPTGTNITATYPFLRMDMTDGSIVSVTDYSTSYLSNSSLVTTVNDLVEQLEESVGDTVEQVQTNTNEIAQMKVTFQDGVDTIYNSIVAEGVTPTASTPSALATAVGSVYDKGVSDAESVTWTEPIYMEDGAGTNAPTTATYTFLSNRYLPYKNLKSIKVTSYTTQGTSYVDDSYININDTQYTLTNGLTIDLSNISSIDIFYIRLSGSGVPVKILSNVYQISVSLTLELTYQAKIIHS